MTHIAALTLLDLEQEVNAALAYLEAAGSEVVSVQVVDPPGPEHHLAAVIVVRTPAASVGDGNERRADRASLPKPRSHAVQSTSRVRDLDLGRRMQEERALTKRIKDAGLL
jgi:hypothetical protein